MINEAQEWGDFSEWLSRINECLEHERSEGHPVVSAEADAPDDLSEFMQALQEWVGLIEDAPMTTWREELSVRGMEFEFTGTEDERELQEKLQKLVRGLAGMRIFLTNTDHLSERQLDQFLLKEILDHPIAQVPLEHDCGCVVDVVGLEVQEDPVSWLTYYASNRERMEWAKQNPGRALPMSLPAPFARDKHLPQP